jgi:hypothetical protein
MCGFFENANVINTTVGLVLALWASATALAWRSKACHDLDTRAINSLLRKSRQASVVIQRQCLRFCFTCVTGSPRSDTADRAWKTYKYFFGAPAANAATQTAQRLVNDTAPALRNAALSDWRTVVVVLVPRFGDVDVGHVPPSRCQPQARRLLLPPHETTD